MANYSLIELAILRPKAAILAALQNARAHPEQSGNIREVLVL